jgi:hypothetical protein
LQRGIAAVVVADMQQRGVAQRARPDQPRGAVVGGAAVGVNMIVPERELLPERISVPGPLLV